MVNIAVFCSGNGSNFQAIINAAKSGLFDAEIALMVCDNPDAYALSRAKKEGVKALLIDVKNFPSQEAFEARIIEELIKEHIGLICLAGYMRLLLPGFINKYREKIINIHPALLPSFKGTRAIGDAFGYGVKATGVTAHFVNEDTDAGPIILQETIKIEENDTKEMLEEKIHKLEHRLYPEAIKLFIEGRLKVIGRRVKIS
jgi:phosphoribosylglycinamide formyltransferase-1